ncbi:MAG: methyl-accepting chemotaxis protein [Gemmatimonadota bacterium]|nr:MAG: methyl-accepting chemotaxis protein [Gemmatimonadota bacterium]
MINTIRSRQAGAFLVLLVGLLAAGLIGINSLSGLAEEFDAGMAQVAQAAALGSNLQRDVLELIFAAEGYLTTGDSEHKQRFGQLAGRTQDVAKRYRELEDRTAGDARLIEGLTAALTQLEVEFARAHALYDIGQRTEARRLADELQPQAAEVVGLISVLGARQARALEASTEALRQRASERSRYVFGILLIALLLGAGLAWATVRSIDRPLAELVTAASRFGGGHLRTRVGTSGMPKEFAELGFSFNAMASSMTDVAGQVVSTASQLSSSAADFSSISEQVAASTHEVALAMTEISEGADRQAGALSETAAAVVELQEGALRIETDANQNRELSHTIQQQAGQSQDSVRQAVALLLSLKEFVHDSAHEFEGLQNATDHITGFVRRIASIAEQTHLLSLNAAIEAAHAGHEGRGFAVVADEVGKLAAEADVAAREVEEVVSQLREQVGATLLKMQEGEGQVVQVEGVARGAEDALDAISAGLATVAQAADQALATVERSRTLLEQVAGHVESVTSTAISHASRSQDVSAAVQEQSATTQEISASVAQLVGAANDLRRIVGEWEV